MGNSSKFIVIAGSMREFEKVAFFDLRLNASNVFMVSEKPPRVDFKFCRDVLKLKKVKRENVVVIDAKTKNEIYILDDVKEER